MPFIRSLASKYRIYIIALIFSLSEIMPTYSYCMGKGLVYITITALFSRQPSSYFKCIKLNIHSSCNVYSVFNAEYLYTL